MTTENERAAIVGERIIALGNELEKYKIQWFERGRRIEDLERQLAEYRKSEDEIAKAIGCNRWLDPPDGGSPSLGEQVRRMHADLDMAESKFSGISGWWHLAKTSPKDGTWFRAKFNDDCEAPARFADDFNGSDFVWRDITGTARKRDALVGWRECANPLPETKKEDVG